MSKKEELAELSELADAFGENTVCTHTYEVNGKKVRVPCSEALKVITGLRALVDGGFDGALSEVHRGATLGVADGEIVYVVREHLGAPTRHFDPFLFLLNHGIVNKAGAITPTAKAVIRDCLIRKGHHDFQLRNVEHYEGRLQEVAAELGLNVKGFWDSPKLM